MKSLSYIAGLGLLFSSSAVIAQDTGQPVPPPTPPASMETVPGDPMAEPSAETPPPAAMAPQSAPMEAEKSFSDAEIEGFAQAMTELQALKAEGALDDAGIQAQAPTIVASNGIDAETFNAIGTATQNDPETAQRVQLAMTAVAGNPGS